MALGPSCSTHLTPNPVPRDTGGGAPPRASVVSGVNPSHLMNLFTYEKGYCFVYYLSQLCGDTQRFDSFLRVSSPSPPRPCPRGPGPGLLSLLVFAGLRGQVQVHQCGGPGPAGLLPELLPGAEGAECGLPGR